jgi:hypothetical protein
MEEPSLAASPGVLGVLLAPPQIVHHVSQCVAACYTPDAAPDDGVLVVHTMATLGAALEHHHAARARGDSNDQP